MPNDPLTWLLAETLDAEAGSDPQSSVPPPRRWPLAVLLAAALGLGFHDAGSRPAPTAHHRQLHRRVTTTVTCVRSHDGRFEVRLRN